MQWPENELNEKYVGNNGLSRKILNSVLTGKRRNKGNEPYILRTSVSIIKTKMETSTAK
jgi:hypothetical protein